MGTFASVPGYYNQPPLQTPHRQQRQEEGMEVDISMMKLINEIKRGFPGEAPVFSGHSGQNVGDWLVTVEDQLLRWGISDKRYKLALATGLLSGNAMAQYRSWEGAEKYEWEAFVGRMKGSFSRPAAWLVDRMDLCNLRQGTGSVHQYLDSFNQAANRMSLGIGEETKTVAFLMGLRQAVRTEVISRASLRADKPTYVFQDVVDLALQVQATQQAPQGSASTSQPQSRGRVRQPVGLNVADMGFDEEMAHFEAEWSDDNEVYAIDPTKPFRRPKKMILEPCACCGKTGHKEESCITAMSRRLAEMEMRIEAGQGKAGGAQ